MKLSTLQKGLVLHAPLSQERYNPATKRVGDLTPYENHGVSANAGVFVADRMGQSDRAMSFNGTSDNIRIPDSEIERRRLSYRALRAADPGAFRSSGSGRRLMCRSGGGPGRS